jgi:hypothetical protein
MHRRWIGVTVIVGVSLATAGTLLAQQRQLALPQPSIMEEQEDAVPAAPPPPAKPTRGHGQMAAPALEPDPDLDAADQLAPSQVRQPMPAAVAEPVGGGRVRAATTGTESLAEPGAAAKRARSANPHVIACSGLFGPESSHLKLAAAFHAKNVTATQVDAASGAKAMASVLFAKDPKERLEVWWSNPAKRSDTHLIVINGQSDWTAPRELRLGLSLPDLEKLNGKPFKLSGFDKNNLATLSDWNGGDLGALPGGCKVGVSLRAALSATAATLSALPADREFSSSDAAWRAANPTVSEILVGY